MKRIFFIIFLLSSTLFFAQEQSLDTSVIRIGEQTKLSVNCNFEKGESFVWPSFNDTLVTGVEIIEKGKIDQSLYSTNFNLRFNFLGL